MVRGRREGGATRGDATTSQRNETTSGQRSDRTMRGRESGMTRGQAMVAVVAVVAWGQWQRWRWRRWTVDESMQKPPSPYNKPSSNLATLNHAPRCKQTMPRHMHYSPTKSYPKHSRPWTCGSTGYGATTPKDNSAITGDLAHRTWQITTPSTTPPHTTSLYAQQFSHQPTIQNTGNSSRTQETARNRRAQIITSEKKTSENHQKLLNRRAQKITREAKLPKIAKKLPSWRGQKIPPITTSQRLIHPVVEYVDRKTNPQFFKANNLLIAKFPRPTSLTSNRSYYLPRGFCPSPLLFLFSDS